MNGYLYDAVMHPLEAFQLKDLRRSLIARVHGKTLEVGFGTGLNLPYYAPEVHLSAVDRSQDMLSKAETRLRDLRQSGHALPALELQVADAEALPFADQSFDSVVATLVFCSVEHPEQALREVFRVLKPGGEFFLLEHVRKDTPVTGRLLDWLTPGWKIIADGCRLNRNPEGAAAELGFVTRHAEILWQGLGRLWILQKPQSKT